MNKINVVGLGYVGLPAALQFANNDYEVIGTDLNADLVSKLSNGQSFFEESEMENELKKALLKGITFSTNCIKADLYIVAVPTNFDKKSKKIDPKHLISAVSNILKICAEDAIIVIESTVSPGTIQRYLKPLSIEKKVHFVHAPERIIPGNTLYELIHNDRIIGSDDFEIGCIVKEVYASFCQGTIRITNLNTAELTKVVENTFRDINIAYANELKKICDRLTINVHEVIELANKHPRVNILNPSAGVGGHCISVDPWFLVGDFVEITPLIATSRGVNDSMPEFTWKKVLKKEEGNKIGIYGLTYKENISDLRESPAIQLFEHLNKKEVQKPDYLYDPHLNEKIFDNQVLEFEKFIDSVEVVLVMAPHDHLKNFLECLNHKNIRIYDPFNRYENTIKI
ncbi:nucleotide sugar dehydrogenase [Enterococcus faecalis]|nr:nucleotide sugar dehydrogenase [Enterococcus faecalis]EGO8860057.1 nucleotide sugar dehydrogenase [Enterococcus faecalis]